MLYLGIDQSLKGTGLAFVDESGAYVASTTVSVGRYVQGAGRLWTVAEGLRDFVDTVLDKKRLYRDDVKAFAREGFSVKSVNRPFDLGMVAGVLELEVYRLFTRELLVVAPTQLKKFATSKSHASKEEMLYTVKQRFGVDLQDRDDEADAVFLALFARASTVLDFTSRAAADVVYKVKTAGTPKPRLRRASSRHNV